MTELIKLQKANGCFPIAALKLFIPSIIENELNTKIPSSVSVTISSEVIAVFITAIVVAIFGKIFPNEQVNWGLIVKKSNIWIQKQSKQLGIPEDFDWSNAASTFLTSQNL